MMQLTRTAGPKAWAKAIVMALRPAFDAEYGMMSAAGWIAPIVEILMIEPPPAGGHTSPDKRCEPKGPSG